MAKEPKIKVFRRSSASYGLLERAILNPVTRWHCKYLQYPNHVDVIYKRLHRLKIPVQQIEWLLLQPFREATVTIMEHSIPPQAGATTVTVGVLQRTIPITPGTGT
jgi:hypothetical protein